MKRFIASTLIIFTFLVTASMNINTADIQEDEKIKWEHNTGVMEISEDGI